MKRTLTILAALLTPACGNTVQPSPLYSSYFLTAVDGAPLPVRFTEDGSVLLAGSLTFPDGSRPRAPGPADGLVSYTILVRRPDQTQEHSTIELNYSIRDGVLRIDLCPPLALCFASTELVGPILGPAEELVLTHYLGGTPGSVYRYFPSLPD